MRETYPAALTGSSSSSESATSIDSSGSASAFGLRLPTTEVAAVEGVTAPDSIAGELISSSEAMAEVVVLRLSGRAGCLRCRDARMTAELPCSRAGRLFHDDLGRREVCATWWIWGKGLGGNLRSSTRSRSRAGDASSRALQTTAVFVLGVCYRTTATIFASSSDVRPPSPFLLSRTKWPIPTPDRVEAGLFRAVGDFSAVRL